MKDRIFEVSCQRAHDDQYLCTMYTVKLRSIDEFLREMLKRYPEMDLRITVEAVHEKETTP